MTVPTPRATRRCTLSIIVPVFNEEEALPALHRRLVQVLRHSGISWEIVYVDDGSSDGTAAVLAALQAGEPAVAVARLSRNFGKEAAMSAGLRLALGQAVVLIDADLQDPPELIPEMVQAWREGADLVQMRRRTRLGETWLKRATAHAFYRVMNRLSQVPIPPDVGDFRLLSRRAVQALNRLPEHNRFMKGLFAWVGFRQVTIDYDRQPRAAGTTKWRYRKLWHFALEGITGFSVAPLKLATWAGGCSARWLRSSTRWSSSSRPWSSGNGWQAFPPSSSRSCCSAAFSCCPSVSWVSTWDACSSRRSGGPSFCWRTTARPGRPGPAS
jgi:glycosyltransferase involved in cell wall biosynthesis